MKFEKLDFNKPVSLHKQITDIIEKNILNKAISIGDKLPSETVLCESFGVNIHTLRKSLTKLVKKGYLLRRQKHGTVVVSSKPSSGIDIKTKNAICLVICTGSYYRPFGTPIFNELINGIEGRAKEIGLNLLYRTLDEKDRKLYLSVKESEIAGLIVTGNVTYRHFSVIKKLGIPFVLIGDIYQQKKTHGAIDIMATDDFRSAYMATKHLLNLGHEKISCVAISFSNYPWNIERLKGYQQALKEANIAFKKNLVAETDISQANAGYIEMKQLLGKSLKLPFSGIVIFDTNFLYFGITKALGEKNIKVPEDVSVVLDEKFADLTSVAVDYRNLGRATLDRLVGKLTSKDWKTERTVIPGKLISGNSVKKFNPR